MTSRSRKFLMLAATAFAIGVPVMQALTDWGLSAQEFSGSGDETLRAAGYAFSIWGLIYAALVVQAGFHLLAPLRHEPLLRALEPAIVAIAGCGGWLIASGTNARWLTVVVILISAATAWWALHRARGQARSQPAHVLAVWPIAMLGGWLLIASVLNVLTVATSAGVITPDIATPVALTSVVVAAGLTLLIVRTGVSAVYGLPVAWGLVGVYVAERGDQPLVAYTALGAAAVVGLASAAFALGRLRATSE